MTTSVISTGENKGSGFAGRPVNFGTLEKQKLLDMTVLLAVNKSWYSTDTSLLSYVRVE